MNKFITAKEIERKYRLSYHIVNRYTNAGLLRVLHRSGNVRVYNRIQVEKSLRQIDALRREGYPLVLIRKKLVGI